MVIAHAALLKPQKKFFLLLNSRRYNAPQTCLNNYLQNIRNTCTAGCKDRVELPSLVVVVIAGNVRIELGCAGLSLGGCALLVGRG